jgi:uncharacterized spore protein YtfJ
MEKIFSAARVGAVFGEPVQVGDYTVITASEVATGGGFGFGRGVGSAPAPTGAPAGSQSRASNGDEPKSAEASGGGGGGGGGGGSTARPVAFIVMGPSGVDVRPIVDVTKIALAALTGLGVLLPIILRIGRR